MMPSLKNPLLVKYLLHRTGLTIVALFVSGILWSCSSDSGDLVNRNTPLTDVYYISIETDAGTAYLDARRSDQLPNVQALVFEPNLTNNRSVAWLFDGETTLSVKSQSNLLGSAVNLVVPADDGLMQIKLVDDTLAQNQSAAWVLTPLGNDSCRISNAGLGNELVLSVTGPSVSTSASVRYPVEMASVDDEVPQQWTVRRVGNPPGNFEELCLTSGDINDALHIP